MPFNLMPWEDAAVMAAALHPVEPFKRICQEAAKAERSRRQAHADTISYYKQQACDLRDELRDSRSEASQLRRDLRRAQREVAFQEDRYTSLRDQLQQKSTRPAPIQAQPRVPAVMGAPPRPKLRIRRAKSTSTDDLERYIRLSVTKASATASTSTTLPPTRKAAAPAPISTILPPTRKTAAPASISIIPPFTRKAAAPAPISIIPPFIRKAAAPVPISTIPPPVTASAWTPRSPSPPSFPSPPPKALVRIASESIVARLIGHMEPEHNTTFERNALRKTFGLSPEPSRCKPISPSPSPSPVSPPPAPTSLASASRPDRPSSQVRPVVPASTTSTSTRPRTATTSSRSRTESTSTRSRTHTRTTAPAPSRREAGGPPSIASTFSETLPLGTISSSSSTSSRPLSSDSRTSSSTSSSRPLPSDSHSSSSTSSSRPRSTTAQVPSLRERLSRKAPLTSAGSGSGSSSSSASASYRLNSPPILPRAQRQPSQTSSRSVSTADTFAERVRRGLAARRRPA
ncbi:hypothetical protein BDV95DRAFT_598186 [Massariosphaeria phaeospora]|uniref:Uncharacterized protein n=1 Tax=Massariosphaeria phaeospora TaxID=100035 RepID=A0A7C8M4W6_9PLEO|nr:hypothetical protein BDV95DRAFT_598186 [Massariosphaeria phaeospora]